MLFVHPWQYSAVMQSLPRRLSHRDVFISESLESLLELELASILSCQGNFQGAWIKARDDLRLEVNSIPSRVGEIGDHPLHRDLVSRWPLSLCTAPLQRPANMVTQSDTTESEPASKMNPRRLLVSEELAHDSS